MKYTIGGTECLCDDPFDIFDFIDENLDHQMKKLFGAKEMKAITPSKKPLYRRGRVGDKQPYILKKRRTTT
jgi:hypothetical protein